MTRGRISRKTGKGSAADLEKEFADQLKGQQDGINALTVGEYIANRGKFEALATKTGSGRGHGGAQRRTRVQFRNSLVTEITNELLLELYPLKKAKAEAACRAEKAMKGLAALHEPDMIGGGYDRTSRLGDGGVNSSIGSQWKGEKKARVNQIDTAANRANISPGPETQMNVKLVRCPKK